MPETTNATTTREIRARSFPASIPAGTRVHANVDRASALITRNGRSVWVSADSVALDRSEPAPRRAITLCEIVAGPAASIPAGQSVLVRPFPGQPDVASVDDESGRPTFLASWDQVQFIEPAPEPRTWAIPDEPTDVTTVWTQDADTGEPVRWDRINPVDQRDGWRPNTNTLGGFWGWDDVLESGPVTEFPYCQDGNGDECLTWVRDVVEAQTERDVHGLAGLYCAPCRAAAIRDAEPEPEPITPGFYRLRGSLDTRSPEPGAIVCVLGREEGHRSWQVMGADGERWPVTETSLRAAGAERVVTP